MINTLKAIYIALQAAPMIALLVSLPQTVISYARTKKVDVRRSTYIYIFTLYFICAYFMTMLPLPEDASQLRSIGESLQLIPFKGFFDIKAESWLPDLAIIVFNVVLTMPLGFFLRFLFGFDLKKTVLAGFLTSAMYELTQISGLLFIFPSPYRIFDIDDFIMNTLGSFLGFLVYPLLIKILPPPADTGGGLVRGSEVSFSQRAVAAIIDFSLTLGAMLAVICFVPTFRSFIANMSPILKFPVFFAVFIFFSVIYSLILAGGTLGHRIVGLRLLTKGGERASRGQTALRSLMIYVCVFSIPFWVLFFMNVNTEYAGIESIFWVFIGALLMMCAARNMLEMMFNAVTHGSSMFYDRAADTFVAYSKSKRASMFGVRVIEIRQLEGNGVVILSDRIAEVLSAYRVKDDAITKVRIMAEGAMLDWIDQGLEENLCELRVDKRFKTRALMLSVPGEDVTGNYRPDSYTSAFEELGLAFDVYYAGEKNICIIHIS